MPVLKIVNRENQSVGEVTVSDKVFGAKVNKHLLWEAVQSHLANQRRGTSSTKTRGEVSGGGAKPWRQKGTGRARAGSNRSPVWYKGGIVFGPKPRDYTWLLPQAQRRQALRSALSAKVADGEVVVLDELKLAQIKTKLLAGLLQNLKLSSGRTTLVLAKADETVRRSGRNIGSLRILNPENINTYDLLNCDHLLLTRDAVNRLEERLNA